MKNKRIPILVIACVLIAAIIGGAIVAFLPPDNGGSVEVEWITVKNATCTEAGEKQCTLADGTIKTESIPALGHDLKSTVTEPACTTEGYTLYKCSRCDKQYVSDFVSEKGHNYGEWETVKEASCNVKGVQKKICSVCNNETRNYIDALGHCFKEQSRTTVSQVVRITYACEHCGKTVVEEEGKELESVIEENNVFETSTDYSFDIVSDQSEEYIRKNLKVVNAYYSDTEFEDAEGVSQQYTLTKKADGVWTVTPIGEYQPDTAYTAKLGGDVKFSEFEGEEMTFTTDETEQKENECQYDDKILFLKKLEQDSPGYYPYSIAFKEDSNKIYLTVKKVNGFEAGKIICIGDVLSIDEVKYDVDCHFGKIESIHLLESGEYMVVLGEPAVYEVFSALDISFEQVLDLENANIDTQKVEKELVSSFYASEDFNNFLTRVNLAAKTYARITTLRRLICPIRRFLIK